jgi:hypothetical protein
MVTTPSLPVEINLRPSAEKVKAVTGPGWTRRVGMIFQVVKLISIRRIRLEKRKPSIYPPTSQAGYRSVANLAHPA